MFMKTALNGHKEGRENSTKPDEGEGLEMKRLGGLNHLYSLWKKRENLFASSRDNATITYYIYRPSRPTGQVGT